MNKKSVLMDKWEFITFKLDVKVAQTSLLTLRTGRASWKRTCHLLLVARPNTPPLPPMSRWVAPPLLPSPKPCLKPDIVCQPPSHSGLGVGGGGGGVCAHLWGPTLPHHLSHADVSHVGTPPPSLHPVLYLFFTPLHSFPTFNLFAAIIPPWAKC